MEIRKLIKDGKVGVVLAKSFDSEGWYTSHEDLQLLFLPELVNLIESDEYKNALYSERLVYKLLTDIGFHGFTGDANGLVVEWLSVNAQFKIKTKDSILRGYYDEVVFVKDDNWIVA